MARPQGTSGSVTVLLTSDPHFPWVPLLTLSLSSHASLSRPPPGPSPSQPVPVPLPARPPPGPSPSRPVPLPDHRTLDPHYPRVPPSQLKTHSHSQVLQPSPRQRYHNTARFQNPINSAMNHNASLSAALFSAIIMEMYLHTRRNAQTTAARAWPKDFRWWIQGWGHTTWNLITLAQPFPTGLEVTHHIPSATLQRVFSAPR